VSTAAGPCAGLTVVELVAGTSELGLGLAGAVPGLVLAELGARVVRVTSAAGTLPIDDHVEWGSVWNRDKEVVATDDVDQVLALLGGADVALVYGPESLVEARGLGREQLLAANPALVHARCRPGSDAAGPVADFGLLVEARAGFCTQLEGHRPGPIFVDVRAPGFGAASVLLVSVLGLLHRRERTGAGGWAETSLYDGLLTTLGCMIGRSERAAPEIESYWEKGSTFPNFLYRCADGELIQVWFGGKGMYGSLIEVLGDEPSDEGYYADQMSGMLGVRATRWTTLFAQQTRDVWVERLRAAKVACEPVLAPGGMLADPHLDEVGLVVTRERDGHTDRMAAAPIAVRPLVDGPDDAPRDRPPVPVPPVTGASGSAGVGGRGGLLAGLRVVDFSAFVAGPLAAQVLADLGADVVKVEPPEGEVMRAAAYAVAACQRGKRSLALNIGAPEAKPVVQRLLAGADVVLHNFRVGVAERLGIAEADLARVNPGAVYCHASAFGPTGPRARYPGNDALMQAVTGFERAVGGAGNEPIAATWIPIDMAGGWVAAAGMAAGLLAQARSGTGQSVSTSLLGSGILLHSEVFQRDGELVRGPELDGDQTGYGPGYRLYRGAGDTWFALVVPDPQAWARLASHPALAGLAQEYTPLRGNRQDDAARTAERHLAQRFAERPAPDWVRELRALDLLVEPVEPRTRDGFRSAVLDDPLNRELGRAIAYRTPDWGHFEQLGPLLRYGPDAGEGPRRILPGIGEHTVEVLTELGFAADEIDALLTAKIARQLDDQEPPA
jgi:crotonobetainyl-CoA:carnitine CoA-transferase CaiB-like acyl-CoA transferase